MKELILLTKVSLGSIFNINKLFKKRNIKYNLKKILGIIGAVLVTLIVLATAYIYSYGIGTILKTLGQLDLLPELLMAVVSLFVIVTTISRVKGTLFGFKDYDLVMSLPIDHKIIVASRLLTLYILNLTFTLIIMVPSSIAYIVLAKPDLGFYAYTILSLIFIPIVPMIIGTVLGTIIVYIASKFKRNNFVNIVLNIILVTGIVFISMFTSSSEEAITQSANYIANAANQIYPLAEVYKGMVIDHNILYFILFVVISLALLMGYVALIGLNFKRINNNITSVATNNKKKRRKYSLSSPVFSLYKKELARYFSSALYVLNTGIGMIMLLVGSIASLFVKNDSLDQLLEIPGFSEMAGTYLPVAIPFFIVLVYTSACSISLEGNNLWIIKSIPVSTKEIFFSKIGVNLTITLPLSLLSIIILSIGLKLSPLHGLVTMAMAIAYAFLTSIFGLLLNLIFPVFEWKSEVTVIKQSMSAFLATLGGIVLALIPIGAQYVLRNITSPNNINLIALSFVALLTLILYQLLIRVGTKLFRAL
jgi:ABC-2 type transport system permease protein